MRRTKKTPPPELNRRQARTDEVPFESTRKILRLILSKRRMSGEIKEWSNRVLIMPWIQVKSMRELFERTKLLGTHPEENPNERPSLVLRALRDANNVFLETIHEHGKYKLLICIGPRATRKNILRAFIRFLSETEEQRNRKLIDSIGQPNHPKPRITTKKKQAE